MTREKMTIRFDQKIAQKIREIALKKQMSESRVTEEAVALGLLKLETLPTSTGKGMDTRLTNAVIQELGGADKTKPKGEQLSEAYGRSILRGNKGWE